MPTNEQALATSLQGSLLKKTKKYIENLKYLFNKKCYAKKLFIKVLAYLLAICAFFSSNTFAETFKFVFNSQLINKLEKQG